MDAATLILALLGGVAGALAMALPGVHVNTLALLTLALAPRAGPAGVPFLLGALAGAPFGLALSTTFLGATGDDSALPAMPAHALAHEGRATEAVARLCWGAFAGLVLAMPLALAAMPAMTWLAPRLADVMPWLLLGIAIALVLAEKARPAVHRRSVVAPWGTRAIEGVLWRDRGRWRIGTQRVLDPHRLLRRHPMGDTVHARVDVEWHRGPLSRPAGKLLALFVLALSGALGLVALRVGAASPFGLPGDALLPLLAGLFAAPALVDALRARSPPPRARLRAPRPARGEILRASLPGALASATLGLAPGVSASMAAMLTPRSKRAERALVTLGAVNGGAVVFGLLAWDALGKARHGALVAAQALAGPPSRAPIALADQAIAVLAAAALACLLARVASPRVARVPQKPLAAVGLALVVGMTFASCGAWGLAVLGVAALVGTVPARLRVRRSLAMGALLVPALLRAWGLA